QCGPPEQRAHQYGVKYEFAQKRSDESVRSFRPRHGYPHRTRGRLQCDAQAVVVLRAELVGVQATETEIARLVRRRRPSGHAVAKLGAGRGNEAALGTPNA